MVVSTTILQQRQRALAFRHNRLGHTTTKKEKLDDVLSSFSLGQGATKRERMDDLLSTSSLLSFFSNDDSTLGSENAVIATGFLPNGPYPTALPIDEESSLRSKPFTELVSTFSSTSPQDVTLTLPIDQHTALIAKSCQRSIHPGNRSMGTGTASRPATPVKIPPPDYFTTITSGNSSYSVSSSPKHQTSKQRHMHAASAAKQRLKAKHLKSATPTNDTTNNGNDVEQDALSSRNGPTTSKAQNMAVAVYSTGHRGRKGRSLNTVLLEQVPCMNSTTCVDNDDNLSSNGSGISDISFVSRTENVTPPPSSAPETGSSISQNQILLLKTARKRLGKGFCSNLFQNRESQSSALKEKNDELESKNIQLEEEKEHLRKQVNSLKDQIQLENERNKLKQQLETLEMQIRLQEENRQLQQAMESLKNQISICEAGSHRSAPSPSPSTSSLGSSSSSSLNENSSPPQEQNKARQRRIQRFQSCSRRSPGGSSPTTLIAN